MTRRRPKGGDAASDPPDDEERSEPLGAAAPSSAQSADDPELERHLDRVLHEPTRAPASNGPVVVVPPDLDVEDRVLGPFTFRQLGYLAVATAGAALLGLGPSLLARLVGLPVLLVGLAVVLLRPDGLPADAWLLQRWAYTRRQRQAARTQNATAITVDEQARVSAPHLDPDPAPPANGWTPPPVNDLNGPRTVDLPEERPTRRRHRPPAWALAAVALVVLVSAGASVLLARSPSSSEPPVSAPATTEAPTPLGPPGPASTPPAPTHPHTPSTNGGTGDALLEELLSSLDP